MANNTHRFVKMFRPVDDFEVSPGFFASVTAITILATSVALLSGGLRSAAILLLPVLPLWLLMNRRPIEARHAALASLTGAGLLAFIDVAGLSPPVMAGLDQAAVWAGAGFLSFVGLVFLGQSAEDSQADEPLHIGPELPAQSHNRTLPALPESGPILLVMVSPMGRVGQIEGARMWLPQLRSGRAADSCLVDRAGKRLRDGQVQLWGDVQAEMRRVSLPRGTLYAFIKTDLRSMESETVRALRRQLEQRTLFFSGLGHDLKSPLNSVLGFADMMQNEIRGPLPEAYKDYPGLIRESGEVLLRLVDDLLAYARSEAGALQIDKVPLNLSATTGDVVKAFAPIASRAGVLLELDQDAEVWIEADPQVVRRIWDNLVSNAIKYSQAGGKVVLGVYRSGSGGVLSVTDDGSGMDAEDLAKIAEPFEQGQNARGRAGTGLGLAMVRTFSDLHGGHTVIRTAPGKGTQVTVTFPLSDAVPEV
jgi:cell cycle sensor histidine kinase DivJ